MGGAVGRVPEDASAFSGRAAGFTFNLISTWSDPGEDSRHVSANSALYAGLLPLTMARTYVNFSPETPTERVRTTYGNGIYDRVARLKREYDPTNLFRRNQNVPPAR